MVERVYIVCDQELDRGNCSAYEWVARAGHTVFSLSQQDGVSADEFVAIGQRASSVMEELRASGISPEKISWLDENGVIRDFHWDKFSRASEIPNSAPHRYLPWQLSKKGEALGACEIAPDDEHDRDEQKDGVDFSVNDLIRWRFPEVVVTAGPYTGGKSLFTQFLAQDFTARYGYPSSICSWEDEEVEIRNGLSRYRDSVVRQRYGSEAANGFLEKFFIAKVNPLDENRYLKDYIDLVEYQAKRFGVKMFILDPWNEFDHQKHSRQSETEYVREVMKHLRRIANKHQIIINIITHVASEYIENNGQLKPFRIAHAFGSSQFANKADRGFCVLRASKWAREGQQHLIVRQDKVKQENKPGRLMMGKRCTMALYFSHGNNAFYYDSKASRNEEVQGLWKG